MRPIASAVWLLALVACSGDPPTPPPAPPVQPAEAPASPGSGAPTAAGDYTHEVDDLLQTLSGTGAADTRPQPAAPGGPRRVVYTIPPVSPAVAEAEARAARLNAYEENLTTCLDGRFPAFCDHALLTEPDAERVQKAEHEANLATCADPEWQHLCSPGLPPDASGARTSAPAAGATPAGAPTRLLP